MAGVSWNLSTKLSHTIFPVLSGLSNTCPANSRPPTFTVGRPIFSPITQHKPQSHAVRAQAKRGFAPRKEDEIASADDMKFKSPLEIVLYPDPKLRAKNKRVGTFDENLKKLADEMFDVMYRTDGIGLSAPQVGVNLQLMVFNPAGERGEGEEIVLVNPRVTRYSRKLIPYEEGCLSFPGINGDVVRPESVKIEAQDITGARFTINLSDLPSRIFQHEFDHLQGILFFERMTVEVVDSILTKLQEMEQKYEDRTGLPSPERIETRKRWKAAAGFGQS